MPDSKGKNKSNNSAAEKFRIEHSTDHIEKTESNIEHYDENSLKDFLNDVAPPNASADNLRGSDQKSQSGTLRQNAPDGVTANVHSEQAEWNHNMSSPAGMRQEADQSSKAADPFNPTDKSVNKILSAEDLDADTSGRISHTDRASGITHYQSEMRNDLEASEHHDPFNPTDNSINNILSVDDKQNDNYRQSSDSSNIRSSSNGIVQQESSIHQMQNSGIQTLPDGITANVHSEQNEWNHNMSMPNNVREEMNRQSKASSDRFNPTNDSIKNILSSENANILSQPSKSFSQQPKTTDRISQTNNKASGIKQSSENGSINFAKNDLNNIIAGAQKNIRNTSASAQDFTQLPDNAQALDGITSNVKNEQKNWENRMNAPAERLNTASGEFNPVNSTVNRILSINNESTPDSAENTASSARQTAIFTNAALRNKGIQQASEDSTWRPTDSQTMSHKNISVTPVAPAFTLSEPNNQFEKTPDAGGPGGIGGSGNHYPVNISHGTENWDTNAEKNAIISVKTTSERRNRLANASATFYAGTGRMLVQQVAINGSTAGTGLGKMLTYSEMAMATVQLINAPIVKARSLPHRMSLQKRFAQTSTIYHSENEMLRALHMSHADFQKGLDNGTIIRDSSGKLIKKITTQSEYIAYMNKRFKMNGTNIHIATNLKGVQLEAVAKRYKKRLLKQAKEKGVSVASLAPALQDLDSVIKVGQSSQLEGKKYRASNPVKRSLAQLVRTLTKNGSLAGTGLQTTIAYTRTAKNTAKLFLGTVRHGQMVASLAIKTTKKAALKAATAAAKRGSKTGAKVLAHHEKKVKKKAVRKAKIKNSKAGKAISKTKGKANKFKNWLHDPLYAKRGSRYLGRWMTNKIKVSRVGRWASNSKVFHNPLTKVIGKAFHGLSWITGRIKYYAYKVKQAVLLAAGGLLLLLIVAAVALSVITSALSGISFLAVKKDDRDVLVDELSGLYKTDMDYMVTNSPSSAIKFSNIRDDDVYEEKAKDYSSKKKFYESTNLAEILSMAYIRFNYDFKHAKYSPATEASAGNNDTSLLSFSDTNNYDFSDAEGKTFEIEDGRAPNGHKYGSEETYTNAWKMEIGRNTLGARWNEYVVAPGTGAQLPQKAIYKAWYDAGKKVSNARKVCLYNGYYLVAVSSMFGKPWDILDVKFDNGQHAACMVMDEKKDGECGGPHGLKYGHDGGTRILESELYCPNNVGAANRAIMSEKGNAQRVVSIKNCGSYLKIHKSAAELANSDDSKKDDKKDKKVSKAATFIATPVMAADNAKAIWDALKAKGYSDVMAAGIMANIYYESSYNPNAPDGGLCQWQGGRWAALQAKEGSAYNTIKGQIDYLDQELTKNYKGVYEHMKTATSASEASKIFTLDFERPASADMRAAQRAPKADEIYKAYATGDDVTTISKTDYNNSDDLLTGMDAVKEYVKDLYYGSHQIVVTRDSSGDVSDLTYQTTYFDNLFSAPLSQNQQIVDSIYGDDAAEGLDGSGMMVDGVIPVPYCNQAQGWYNPSTHSYSTDNFSTIIPGTSKTMHEAGCGLCSTAMAVSYGTGKKIDPGKFNATYIPGGGSTSDCAEKGAKKYGLDATRTGSLAEATKALQKGYPVVEHVDSVFTSSGGHFITLIGYKDGKYMVNDPGGQNRTYTYNKKTYTEADIKKAEKDVDSACYTIVVPDESVLGDATNNGAQMPEAQSKVIELAKSRLGCTYKANACHSEAELKNKDQKYFDCSGFASWVFYQAGIIHSAKDSTSWANGGTAVNGLSNAVPGDILVRISSSGSNHTAIYIGNNKMIEAPNTGNPVKITKVRSDMTHTIRRYLTNVASGTASGSVNIGGKVYTSQALVKKLTSYASSDKTFGCKPGQCGVWVRKALSTLSGGDENRISGLGTNTAYEYGVSCNASANVNNDIPIGADVIFKYSKDHKGYKAPEPGHIGIYIGNDQYVSLLGTKGDPVAIRNVHGRNGLTNLGGSFYGWTWHKFGGSDFTKPAK